MTEAVKYDFPVEMAANLILAFDKEEKERCESNYFEFFKRAWQILEPEIPLILNWHLEYLCEIAQSEVERIARRDPKTSDLAINISPRSAKSYIWSIMLCPWAWTRFPWMRFINSSWNSGLAELHTVQGRQIINSEWYQNHWGHMFRMTTDQNVKGHYVNDKTGARYAASVGGGAAGHGADIITGDDLNKPEDDGGSGQARAAVNHWRKGLWPRLNDKRVGLRVIIQQRTDDEDVTGKVVDGGSGKNYRKIVIPAEDKPELMQPPEIGKHYRNGSFFPELFGPEVLEAAKEEMLDYEAQYNQDTTKIGGTILLEEWWMFYDSLPIRPDRAIMSLDCAFKDGLGHSWVVMQVWWKKMANSYLVDSRRGHWDLNATLDQFESLCADHPEVKEKLIEDKANGTNVIKAFKDKISGIIAIEPKGTKVARAFATTPYMRAGNVWLPREKDRAFVRPFIKECSHFKSETSKPNDQVDAYSQAMEELYMKESAIPQIGIIMPRIA